MSFGTKQSGVVASEGCANNATLNCSICRIAVFIERISFRSQCCQLVDTHMISGQPCRRVLCLVRGKPRQSQSGSYCDVKRLMTAVENHPRGGVSGGNLELFMDVWPPRPRPPLMRTFALVCLCMLLVVAAALPLGDHLQGSRDSAPAAALVVHLQEESVTKPGADDVSLPRISSKPPVQHSGHFGHPIGSHQRGSGVKQAKWFQKVDHRRDGASYEVKDSPISTPSTPPAIVESSSSFSSRPSSSSATQRIAVSKEKNVDVADSANRWEHQDYDWR